MALIKGSGIYPAHIHLTAHIWFERIRKTETGMGVRFVFKARAQSTEPCLNTLTKTLKKRWTNDLICSFLIFQPYQEGFTGVFEVVGHPVLKRRRLNTSRLGFLCFAFSCLKWFSNITQGQLPFLSGKTFQTCGSSSLHPAFVKSYLSLYTIWKRPNDPSRGTD